MMDGGWPGVSAAATGLLAEPIGAPVNDLLLDIKHASAGQSYLEWTKFRSAAELHTQLVAPEQESDKRRLDALSQCATRIAVTNSIPQSTAERFVDTALALRDRLPKVAECLRDGLIAPRDVRMLVERTDLITDPDHQKAVDADIAAALRRKGSWSANRMRDMIDRSVFRVDPAAVRARRKAAVEARSFWLERREDGMAEVGSTTSAEKAIVMFRRVEALAACVCKADPRTKSARKSDAHFCLLMGVPWECLCDGDHCDADPVPDTAAPASRDVPGTTGTKAVVHVLCDLETAAGDGENPGFIDGYGVVTADHVRDIMNDPTTTVRPMGADDAPLTPTQPGDPYRPSAACDTVVRARGLYCDVSGCNQPAWRCDLDHVCEYNHQHPAEGGQTCPAGMGPKCRFHHNNKTFTEFLDDITVDQDGRTETVIVTPEGLIVPGPAFTGDDLFPGLRDIEFEKSTHAPPDTESSTENEPTRRRTRLEDKHARRQYERAQNQKDIDAAAESTADAVIDTPAHTATDSMNGFEDEPPF